MENATLELQVIYNRIQHHETYLKRYALLLTQDEQNADDLYQDTIFRIITNATKFKPDTNFGGWSTTVMRNLFINNYRKQSRRRSLVERIPSDHYEYIGDKSVGNLGERSLIESELFELINVLSKDLRTTFLLFYLGFSYQEIADQLGVSIGTIKSRMFFARKKLQKAYHRLEAA